jgi:uncharacterized protein YabN with tetrapyrrole methylase and pyrophosphatase domain
MELHIIGTGIKRPMQLTLEGLRALQQADRVLHLTGTTEPMEALFRELGITQPQALDSLYEHGGVDGANYERLADAVVAQAQCHERVALLIYGHPRVGVSLTSMLEARLGNAVRVIPAPSSFDTMINDLRRDPLHRGSVLLDANRALLFEPTLDPTIDCYIFHVDSVATRKTANGDEGHGRRDLLQAYLLRFYPPEHLVTIVASAVGDEPAATVEVPLADFEAAAQLMSQGATLFLPAMRPRSLNRAVRDLLLASAPGA